jgi:hypothetical protein
MSYNLHIIQTTDFVRLDAHGEPDMVASRLALERVAKACIDRGTDAALLDVREMHDHLSLGDLYKLVGAFHDMGFRHHHRLAILHRFSSSENSDFFALCASTRGWQVRSFSEFEEAMDWFRKDLPVL